MAVVSTSYAKSLNSWKLEEWPWKGCEWNEQLIEK